jgi:peptidoglycan/LPS O-acetylase OafA/YrhL
MEASEIFNFGVIVILISFAVFIGIKRFLSAKRGEPTEDELSKKILHRAAGFSYYISIYLWLAIMYFSDRTELENHTLIGVGILGMALIFAICWSVIHLTGLKND